MKKVCLVFHSSDRYSGATRSLLDLIETWKKNNLIEIVCLLPEEGTVCNVLSELSVKWYIGNYHSARYLTTEPVSSRIFRNIIRRIRLIKEYFLEINYISSILNKEEIELVYSNTGSIYFGAWLSKKMKLPHVWHIRELGKEDQNARMLFGEKHFIRLLNSADGIIAISNTVKDKYSKLVNNPDKIHMLYNDISISNSVFIRRKKQQECNIIIVGSIIEGKGHEQVIRAIEKVRNNGIDAHLYVAGKNSGAYYEKIKKLAEELRIDESVHFLGHIKDMVTIKEKMHLQVVASRCEAFGRITIEAMLCGLPVVGADTGCTKELISDGSNGYLYHWGNIDDLSNKIGVAYHNYDNTCNLANNAYKYALQFTKGSTARKIADLIEMME